MEFLQMGCGMTHSVQSENNAAESILNFLKFSKTGLADPIIILKDCSINS